MNCFKNLLSRYFYSDGDPAGAVLMYHRIAERPDSFPGADEYTVTPDVFDKQLQFLKHRYNLISVQQLVQGLDGGGSLPPRPVAITFDDGYRDTYEQALPLLNKHDVPATVFLTIKFIEHDINPIEFELAAMIRNLYKITVPDQEITRQFEIQTVDQKENRYHEIKAHIKHRTPGVRQEFLARLKKLNETEAVEDGMSAPSLMLTWTQCEELAREPLITLGSHAVDHVPLSVWKSDRTRRDQMERSKEALERNLGVDVRLFSYPYGDQNAAVREAMGKIEYTAAFSTGDDLIHSGNKGEKYSLPRLEAPIIDINQHRLMDRLNRLQ